VDRRRRTRRSTRRLHLAPHRRRAQPAAPVLRPLQRAGIRLDRYLRLIHLLRQGWENDAIALDLDITEDHVAGMRKYLKRWLIDYCYAHNIPFEKDWSPGSHGHASMSAYYTVRRRSKH